MAQWRGHSGGFPSEEEERAMDAAGKLLDLGVDHTDKVVGGTYIPYPRANGPVAIPTRRTGGSFVRAPQSMKEMALLWHHGTIAPRAPIFLLEISS